jgi:hypothetical protein
MFTMTMREVRSSGTQPSLVSANRCFPDAFGLFTHCLYAESWIREFQLAIVLDLVFAFFSVDLFVKYSYPNKALECDVLVVR